MLYYKSHCGQPETYTALSKGRRAGREQPLGPFQLADRLVETSADRLLVAIYFLCLMN